MFGGDVCAQIGKHGVEVEPVLVAPIKEGGGEGAAVHGSKPRMMRLHELRTVPRMACAT